jgi:hypothetical protein
MTHDLGGVTLLPYKGMGQSEQLQSPSIWGEVKKLEMLLCYNY